jgi:hypothetical protein
MVTLRNAGERCGLLKAVKEGRVTLHFANLSIDHYNFVNNYPSDVYQDGRMDHITQSELDGYWGIV